MPAYPPKNGGRKKREIRGHDKKKNRHSRLRAEPPFGGQARTSRFLDSAFKAGF
jgi:hypothetical protein